MNQEKKYSEIPSHVHKYRNHGPAINRVLGTRKNGSNPNINNIRMEYK